MKSERLIFWIWLNSVLCLIGILILIDNLVLK